MADYHCPRKTLSHFSVEQNRTPRDWMVETMQSSMLNFRITCHNLCKTVEILPLPPLPLKSRPHPYSHVLTACCPACTRSSTISSQEFFVALSSIGALLAGIDGARTLTARRKNYLSESDRFVVRTDNCYASLTSPST